jgi:hypothetical protein
MTYSIPAHGRRVWLIFALLCLGLLLAGCSPAVGRELIAPTAPQAITLEQGMTIGQTFVAHYDGLAGIEVYIQPRDAGEGELQLRLRSDPRSPTDLATARLSLSEIGRPGFYQLSFAPQPDSRGRDYYALFELVGAGRIKLDRAAGDAYLDGALYQDGQATDAQVTGTLIYNTPQILLGLVQRLLTWLALLLAGICLFVIPGWALLGLWPGARDCSWGEKLGLAAGLSLALYPLLLLWTNLVGLHLGALYAWLPSLVGLVVLLWSNSDWRPHMLPAAWRTWRRSAAFWPDLLLVIVLLLLGVGRFQVADSLDVPLWGDSYHHTVIAQLLVDNGGLFDSWQPYAEMQTFTYHFGFHSAVAALHWLSGLALPQAVVWAGQLLNVLAVLALYPLAVRLGGSRWAGVAAVLLAGLIAPMPSSYVNWGRYTQLAGQAILPAAIYLSWVAVADQRPAGTNATSTIGQRIGWPFLILPWIALAGLGLAHYRVLIFVVFFFPALFLLELGRQPLRSQLARMAVVGFGGALLFLPWFIHVFAGQIIDHFAIRLATPASALPAATQEYNAAIDPRIVLPALAWLLVLLSLAWGLWRRERGAALIGLWWLLVLLAVNPHWLGLPGTGALTNFALLIAAYIPASVLVGAALGWLVGPAGSWAENQAPRTENQELRHGLHLRAAGGWQWVLRGAGMLALVALALWGTRQRLDDLQVVQSALVTRPDLRAAAWISANTPADSRFLVNAFFAYSGSSVVGSDGGWWLPLLAGRQTTLPPILYGSEQAPRADYRLWINALTAALEQKPIDDPEMLAMLRERGITHIYIGQRQGRLNYAGPAVLNPEQLRNSSHFRPIYHEDRVWVFELLR